MNTINNNSTVNVNVTEMAEALRSLPSHTLAYMAQAESELGDLARSVLTARENAARPEPTLGKKAARLNDLATALYMDGDDVNDIADEALALATELQDEEVMEMAKNVIALRDGTLGQTVPMRTVFVNTVSFLSTTSNLTGDEVARSFYASDMLYRRFGKAAKRYECMELVEVRREALYGVKNALVIEMRDKETGKVYRVSYAQARRKDGTLVFSKDGSRRMAWSTDEKVVVADGVETPVNAATGESVTWKQHKSEAMIRRMAVDAGKDPFGQPTIFVLIGLFLSGHMPIILGGNRDVARRRMHEVANS